LSCYFSKMLKHLIHHDDKLNQHVPIPRYNPKERTMVMQKMPLHPIVYEGAISEGNQPEKNFKAFDDHEYQSKFVNNIQNPSTINYPLPKNILDRPVYPGNNLDIEPRNPQYRDASVIYEKPNTFTRLGQCRNEQFLKSDGSDATQATYDNSKFGPFEMIKKSNGNNNTMKRMQPMQELLFYEDNAPAQNLNKNLPAQNAMLWRNYNQYDNHPVGYEMQNNKVRDYRLEKRKERQEAYKMRRETKKEKEEMLMNLYIQNKNAYYNNSQPSISV